MTEGLVGRTDPLVGTVLDKDYQTLRRIGIGGMSIVYLVEHKRLAKQMAAKLLNAELAANSEALSRFETEAKSASSLEHENIVRVSDYGVAVDGRPYIIMELLKGQTLDEYLVEQPLTLEESVLVVVAVCRGLAAAHADGIIHRDIKPDNIFLTQRPNGTFGVKLLDFGIAKAPLLTGRQTKNGQTIGTPHYMAPEACRGQEIDNRADIYSVGVLMYLLFTGQLPHHDDNFLALLQKHVAEPVVPPSKHNPAMMPALEEVILTALAKDPDDRFSSVEHLLSEFELALPAGANFLLLSAARVSAPIPTITSTAMAALRSPTVDRMVSRSSQPLPSAMATPPTTTSAPPSPAPRAKSKLPLILIGAIALIGSAIAIVTITSGGAHPAPVAAASPTVREAPVTPAGSAVTVARTPAPPQAPAETQAPPSVAKVRLTITTRPPNAVVKLDGLALGRTPLDVEVAPVDAASLQVTADGYEVQTRALALVSDQTLDLALTRKPVARPASARPERPRVPTPPTTSPKPDKGSGDSDLDIRMQR